MLIFDFDGVIADSEVIGCGLLGEQIRLLGGNITTEESISLFVGKRFEDIERITKELKGVVLPSGFETKYLQLVQEEFQRNLLPVNGVSEFIKRHAKVRQCIASSSSLRRLKLSLQHLNFYEKFKGKYYSADKVRYGKPSPDIFLYAAQRNNVKPESCIVIEDSESGVQAGIAAGMTVIGILAASHIREGHDIKLRQAGAQFVVSNYIEASTIIEGVFNGTILVQRTVKRNRL